MSNDGAQPFLMVQGIQEFQLHTRTAVVVWYGAMVKVSEACGRNLESGTRGSESRLKLRGTPRVDINVCQASLLARLAYGPPRLKVHASELHSLGRLMAHGLNSGHPTSVVSR